MSKLYVLFSFTLIFFVHLIYAQKWEVGIGAGPTNLRTDIAHLNYSDTQYGVNIFMRLNVNETWVWRAEYKQLRVGSSDAYSAGQLANLRSATVRNQIREGSISLEYNFLNFRSANKKVKWTPFAGLGLGYFRFSDYVFGSKIGRHNVSIPMSLGVKYVVNRHLNLGLLFTASKTFNDRLDDISLYHPGYKSEKIRGSDPSTKDWFYYLGLHLSYTFYTIECPSFYEL